MKEITTVITAQITAISKVADEKADDFLSKRADLED